MVLKFWKWTIRYLNGYNFLSVLPVYALNHYCINWNKIAINFLWRISFDPLAWIFNNRTTRNTHECTQKFYAVRSTRWQFEDILIATTFFDYLQIVRIGWWKPPPLQSSFTNTSPPLLPLYLVVTPLGMQLRVIVFENRASFENENNSIA